MPIDTNRAACLGEDPEMFFDRGRIRQAQRICAICPLAAACLEEALRVETNIHMAETNAAGDFTGRIRADGVYGGLTGRQRLPLIAERARRRRQLAAA